MSVDVLGVRVDATSYEDATRQVLRWGAQRASKYICCANVHAVMHAQESPDFARALADAALVTPDGMPLVWFLRASGVPQTRVYGPDLMLHVCRAAAESGATVGLFGSTEATLERLVANLTRRYPTLRITFRHAPPFRPTTAEEDAQVQQALAASGAQILFVGLGCPKQELWMAEHVRRSSVVMLGVGAAFDFHAGTVAQAPAWMQRNGLEWAFRLSKEPSRLLMRYAKHNPRFVARATVALTRRLLSRARR